MLLIVLSKNRPQKVWSETDITELLVFGYKRILAGELDANHPVWNSEFPNPSGLKILDLLVPISKYQLHHVLYVTLLTGVVM
jgi:hypothetical protein